MKRILFTLLAALALFSGNETKAADGVLRVKGTLKNFGDSALVVVAVPDNDEGRRETVKLNNGSFDFTIKLDAVRDVYFVSQDAMQGKRGPYISFIAVPGETVEISGDPDKEYFLTGTKFYKEFHELDLATDAAKKELSDYMASLNERIEKGEKQETVIEGTRAKVEEMRKKVANAGIDFLKKHPDYEASVYTISRINDLDKMEEAIKLLSPAVREGRMKAYYEQYLNRLREKKEMDERAKKMQAAGVEAPAFTLDDINGKALSLSSLRGKYVVLDFWGSWCGWCIKGFPKMKEYYEKYKGKFEILGIDCGDTQDKWKQAVKTHELPWLNVYNPKNSKVTNEYAIQGFPTKIIVGPDGKIVKTIVGEDPAFYTLLDELFGK